MGYALDRRRSGGVLGVLRERRCVVATGVTGVFEAVHSLEPPGTGDVGASAFGAGFHVSVWMCPARARSSGTTREEGSVMETGEGAGNVHECCPLFCDHEAFA